MGGLDMKTSKKNILLIPVIGLMAILLSLAKSSGQQIFADIFDPAEKSDQVNVSVYDTGGDAFFSAYLNETYSEPSVLYENWMFDLNAPDGNFQEEEIVLENWMLRFTPLNKQGEEERMKLERWMLKEFPIRSVIYKEEKDPVINLESWMLKI